MIERPTFFSKVLAEFFEVLVEETAFGLVLLVSSAVVLFFFLFTCFFGGCRFFLLAGC